MNELLIDTTYEWAIDWHHLWPTLILDYTFKQDSEAQLSETFKC
jgi:hypothetical protein